MDQRWNDVHNKETEGGSKHGRGLIIGALCVAGGSGSS
jgi:hypothetical protein